MYLKVAKVREDAILPQRANQSDAGADVFYCGDEEITLKFGDNHVFDTGLIVEVPHGFALQVLNRSSMAANHGFMVGACLIDPGYFSNLMIDLHLLSPCLGSYGYRVIKPGDKIAQVICVPIIHWQPIEVSRSDLYEEINVISNRNEGGFGSTGT